MSLNRNLTRELIGEDKIIKDTIIYGIQHKEIQIRKFIIEKGGRLLDIGCGSTGFFYYGTLNGVEYYGTDIKDIKGFKNFIRQDLEKDVRLPFEKEFFDIILASDVLEHLNNRHEIMEEMKRLLKKDGIIIISLPNEFSYQPLWYHLKGVNWISHGEGGHKYFYGIVSGREYIEQHLEIIEEKYFYLDGKMEIFRSLSQWLAEKSPRWFARNILYKCKKGENQYEIL